MEVKKPHFEINVVINREDSQKKFAKYSGQTYTKFFILSKVTADELKNQVKFEVANYAQDIINKSKKKTEIENSIKKVKHHEKGEFIKNVY